MGLLRQFRYNYGWLISCVPALGGFIYGYAFGLNGLVVVQVSQPHAASPYHTHRGAGSATICSASRRS
jgi:hypothetical protein